MHCTSGSLPQPNFGINVGKEASATMTRDVQASPNCICCNRCMIAVVYNIYDEEMQPYKSFENLFGIEIRIVAEKSIICGECLYLIRWLYFLKQMLFESIYEKAIGDNSKILYAFGIFKEKINQVILLPNQDDGDEAESDSEHSVMSPIDLSNQIQHDTRHTTEKSTQTDEFLEYEHNCDKLFNFPCTVNVCEKRFDTFDEILNHYELHHGVDGGDIALEDYEAQLHQYNIQGMSKSLESSETTKKFQFRCLLAICKQRRRSIEELTDHKMQDHNLMRLFHCNNCKNGSFTSQIDLNHHIFERHNCVDLGCNLCNMKFTGFIPYQLHIDTHYNSIAINPIARYFEEEREIGILRRYHSNKTKTTSPEPIDAGSKFRVLIQEGCSSLVDLESYYELVRDTNSSPDVAASVEDRLAISLPPRKRRNYAIALEETDESTETTVTQPPEVADVATSPRDVIDITLDQQESQEIRDMIANKMPSPIKMELITKIKERASHKQLCDFVEECSPPQTTSAGDVIISDANERNNEETETEIVIENINIADESFANEIEQPFENEENEEVVESANDAEKNESPNESDDANAIMPCIVKTIEAIEPNESSSSGKLIMTISLKPFEKYKGAGEKRKHHTRSKRKKHSKMKKRSRHSRELDTDEDEELLLIQEDEPTLVNDDMQLSALDTNEIPETVEAWDDCSVQILKTIDIPEELRKDLDEDFKGSKRGRKKIQEKRQNKDIAGEEQKQSEQGETNAAEDTTATKLGRKRRNICEEGTKSKVQRVENEMEDKQHEENHAAVNTMKKNASESNVAGKRKGTTYQTGRWKKVRQVEDVVEPEQHEEKDESESVIIAPEAKVGGETKVRKIQRGRKKKDRNVDDVVEHEQNVATEPTTNIIAPISNIGEKKKCSKCPEARRIQFSKIEDTIEAVQLEEKNDTSKMNAESNVGVKRRGRKKNTKKIEDEAEVEQDATETATKILVPQSKVTGKRRGRIGRSKTDKAGEETDKHNEKDATNTSAAVANTLEPKKGAQRGRKKVQKQTVPTYKADSEKESAEQEKESEDIVFWEEDNKVFVVSSDDDEVIPSLVVIPQYVKNQCTISSQAKVVNKDVLQAKSAVNDVTLKMPNGKTFNRDEINQIILGDGGSNSRQ